jgi:nitrogenase-stabilizing/protective protein
MKTAEEFYRLKDAEEYFNFFDIGFDKHLIDVKRFHIMKEYGTLIKKGMASFENDETKLLDFFKFALIKVYMDYKSGYNPSAAEVWGMIDEGKFKGCLACAMQGENCAC